MHVDNIRQFLPESISNVDNPIATILFATIVIIVVRQGIVVLKNFFKAFEAVYGKSDYKDAVWMHKLDKTAVLVCFLSPIIFGICVMFYPYEFYVTYEKDVIIKDYSGGQQAYVPDKILFWNVIEIDEEAFAGCEKLVEVELPVTVTKINPRAFANCENLEKVTYSEDIEYIGEFAFANCKKLKEIVTPGGNTSVGTGAFLNTAWLYGRDEDYVIIGEQHYIYLGDETRVIIPEGIKTVDFYLNKTIESVKLPENFGSFQDYCFQGCSSLSNMPLPSNTRWGAYCFGGCSKLQTLKGSYDTLALHGNIYSCEVDVPFEIDEELKKQCQNK